MRGPVDAATVVGSLQHGCGSLCRRKFKLYYRGPNERCNASDADFLLPLRKDSHPTGSIPPLALLAWSDHEKQMCVLRLHLIIVDTRRKWTHRYLEWADGGRAPMCHAATPFHEEDMPRIEEVRKAQLPVCLWLRRRWQSFPTIDAVARESPGWRLHCCGFSLWCMAGAEG